MGQLVCYLETPALPSSPGLCCLSPKRVKVLWGREWRDMGGSRQKRHLEPTWRRERLRETWSAALRGLGVGAEGAGTSLPHL